MNNCAVSNVSGYRCVSDCRSRGREFDPGPVPYFRGDWSWNNFYGHSPPSADLFKKGCCQLQAKVCAQITGQPLAQACPGKSVVKWTDRPAMTIAVDMGRKATKTNKSWTTDSYVLTQKGVFPVCMKEACSMDKGRFSKISKINCLSTGLDKLQTQIRLQSDHSLLCLLFRQAFREFQVW